MSHELFLLKDGKKQNITQLVGNLAWSSNIDSLGTELSFDYAYNDTLHFKKYDMIEAGDHIALMNGNRYLGRFVVVEEAVSGRFGKPYTCFDYAWYLNKNETVIQFNKISASQAIKKLLDKFGVKHRIPTINTLITKIYKGQTVSDIIRDILDQVEKEINKKYRLEMDKDTVVVLDAKSIIINPTFKQSSNLSPVPIVAAMQSPNVTRSIEDLKNNVIVVKGGDDNVKVLATSKDQASINKFGLLSRVVEVDEKNEAQARNIARNTLSEANKIGETISVPLIGHDDIKAGRTLVIKEEITGLNGKYLIKTASHTENKGIHLVTVELEATA